LKQHADRVFEKEGHLRGAKPTRKRIKNIAEWAEQAGDHDPLRDQAGSAKWEAILSEIMGGNDEETIDLLRGLTSLDIKIISNLDGTRVSIDHDSEQRLIEAGILQKKRPFYLLTGFRALTSFSMFLMLTFIVWTLSDFMTGKDSVFFRGLNVDSVFVDYFLFSIFVFSLSALLGALVFVMSNEKNVNYTQMGKIVKEKIDMYLR
jgi:hypothetical protein